MIVDMTLDEITNWGITAHELQRAQMEAMKK